MAFKGYLMNGSYVHQCESDLRWEVGQWLSHLVMVTDCLGYFKADDGAWITYAKHGKAVKQFECFEDEVPKAILMMHLINT